MTALPIVGLLIVQLVLILLPVVAGACVALRRGVSNWLIVLMLGLSSLGVLGFATFWVYLLNPTLGHDFAIAVDAGCAVVIAWYLWRTGRAGLEPFKVFAAPTALFGAVSLMNLALGFLHGGTQTADVTSANRYVHPLPDDNVIPLIFARDLQSSVRPLPKLLVGAWQSSDRPPLQTGMYLLQRALLGPSEVLLRYEVLGVLAQSLWVFGVWAFLRAAGSSSRLQSLGLTAALFSGFTLVNTFFTWPKLLPAAYLMLAAAVLLTPAFEELQRRVAEALAVGVCTGCAMLAHPGSAFVVVAAVIALLLGRRFLNWRFAAFAVLAAVLTYLPWLLYQKFYDPPGDKLDELQLASAPVLVPHESLTQVIVNAYRAVGWSTALANKRANFATPFTGSTTYFRDQARLISAMFSSGLSSQQTKTATMVITEHNFFDVSPCLGLVGFGMVLLVIAVIGRRLWPTARWIVRLPGDDAWWRGMKLTILCFLISYVVWSLVLFGPRSTIVHAGSYYIELTGFVLGVIGWWLVAPRLAALVVVAQAAWTMWIYTFLTPQRTGPATGLTAAVSRSTATLFALSLVLCIACLWWIFRSDRNVTASRAWLPRRFQQHKPATAAVVDHDPFR